MGVSVACFSARLELIVADRHVNALQPNQGGFEKISDLRFSPLNIFLFLPHLISSFLHTY